MGHDLSVGMQNPMTTRGDLIIEGAGPAPARLGAGTSGHFLQTQGPGADPVWAAASGGGVTVVATGSDPGATGNNPALATYTPGADGTFSVQGYMSLAASASANLQMKVTYTDRNGNTFTTSLFFQDGFLGGMSDGPFNGSATVHPYAGFPLTFRAKGGTTITVATVGFISGSFDAFAAISQVQ